MRFILACMAATVFIAITVWSPPAGAGTQEDAVFALHAKSHLLKGDLCDALEQFYAQGSDCTDFNTAGGVATSYGYDLYIVVAGADPVHGVAFASFGIQYNGWMTGAATMNDLTGVDVYSWTPCHSGTSVPYPPATSPDTFPASGSGLRISWDAESDCQTTVPGNAGTEVVIGCLYVYAYSRDTFQIAENEQAPDGPEYLVGDCNGEWSELSVGHSYGNLPHVDFTPGVVEYGNNPCYFVPVRTLSWSRLKTTYK